MNISFERAEDSHLDTLLVFAQDFYREDNHPFEAGLVRRGLTHLLGDQPWGQVWLIRSGGELCGYLVLTLGYRLAYGRYAFVDEIYVHPNYRGQGIGRQALAFAEEVCRELGVKALHLEVEQANTRAQALYAAIGFTDYHHYLSTCWLAAKNIFAGDVTLGLTFTPIQALDTDVLVDLRQAAGVKSRAESQETTGQLLKDSALGQGWLIQAGSQPMGYIVVTFGYSLEFHGRDALLDEWYLSPGLYRLDLAVASLKFVQAQCQATGLNALHAELERSDTASRKLYQSAGFEDDTSYLMTKWLS